MRARAFACAGLAALVLAVAAPSAQDAPPSPVEALHQPFDEILDAYVRDGLVYYAALKQERPKFDRYVAALSAVPAAAMAQWTPGRQLAYWINVYNAFVLQSVIDHYPIRGKAADYPPNSLRQVPGAFERRTFRAGGRTLTLDGLERDVIAGFGDARALLALGRGAIGSARLKSEAYTAGRLDAQLASMAREIVDRREMVQVNRESNELSVSVLFSWRESAFSVFADRAPDLFRDRSPIERAVLALVDPVVMPAEETFLKQNQFRMVFHDFDWRLNDLTNRGR